MALIIVVSQVATLKKNQYNELEFIILVHKATTTRKRKPQQ
jgi:hypothetical protein